VKISNFILQRIKLFLRNALYIIYILLLFQWTLIAWFPFLGSTLRAFVALVNNSIPACLNCSRDLMISSFFDYLKMRTNVRTRMVDARLNVWTLSAVTSVLVEKDLFFRKINTAVRKVRHFQWNHSLQSPLIRSPPYYDYFYCPGETPIHYLIRLMRPPRGYRLSAIPIFPSDHSCRS